MLDLKKNKSIIVIILSEFYIEWKFKVKNKYLKKYKILNKKNICRKRYFILMFIFYGWLFMLCVKFYY